MTRIPIFFTLPLARKYYRLDYMGTDFSFPLIDLFGRI